MILLTALFIPFVNSFSIAADRCELSVTDLDFPPIIVDQDFELVPPELDSDEQTIIPLENGQEVMFACPGTSFDDSDLGSEPLLVKCEGGQDLSVMNEGVQKTNWWDMGCKIQPRDNAEVIGSCGKNNQATLIRIGFQVSENSLPEQDTDIPTIIVCHDLTASASLWAMHSLWDEIDAQQHNNDRPDFRADDFFTYDVMQAYTRDDQQAAVADLVGSMDLAKEYIEWYGSDVYLARGHLAPNADFAYYSLMDSTFHYINVAPQWQTFNGGNWMYFEIGVRDFVTERNIDATVYTGTHGVMELADINGNMVDIYLHKSNQLPVPRFYWKIIYDPATNAGVAVVGVNNPHLAKIDESYILCPAVENAAILSNIYHADDIYKGYMYACRVEDLALAVDEIPELPIMSLLN